MDSPPSPLLRASHQTDDSDSNSLADAGFNNVPAQLESSDSEPGLKDNSTLVPDGSPVMLESPPEPQSQDQDNTTASDPEDGPLLSTIYLQIEYATTPFEVLGVNTNASSREMRAKYLELALRIHPDKAPDDRLRELHTPLFQKVRDAYQKIVELHLGDHEDNSPERLPESDATLHARNVAFREGLRKERERVIKAKHIADKFQADKQARLQAKNDRLAEHRRARAEAALQKLKKQRETQEDEQRVKQRENARRTSERVTNDDERKQGPRPTRDPSLDEPLACKAEIRSRWDKKLLSGGTSGSVSFSEKKQRENNAQARMHRLSLALVEEADRLIRPALTGSGSHWFSGLAEEELLQRAFVETEMLGEMRMEWFLRELDVDVRERYLLGEEGLGSVQVGLLEFVVGDEQVLLLEDGGRDGI